VVRALHRAGFVDDRQSGSHLTLLHPGTGRRAVVPMHSRDLRVGTLASILREAGLSVEEFVELLR
jgi:predicted RNA binding protein YcfA (HicA-like mRNA interferase family)